MSNNFEWQTEEEVVWEDLPPVEEESTAGQQRPWRLIILILAALVVAGAVVWREVDQQVDQAATMAEANVLSSHRLVRQAALRQDADLFFSLLSGRIPMWTDAQQALLQRGLFLDRTPFGLQLLADPEEPASDDMGDLSTQDLGVVNVDISPDLNSAEVLFEQQYALVGEGTVTKTVTLQQTAVYRRGSQRWLLSPPESDFWGQWRTLEEPRLTLAYPTRDEAIAERLAPDLARGLDEACQTLEDLVCPADLHLQVRLEDDPASLAQTADPTELLSNGLRLQLPAPTLVGLPTDEAGYEALLDGYTAQLVSAVVTELVGWDCCRHVLFYQALLDYQLHQLGLRPWPVTDADYLRMLSRGRNVDDFDRYWYENEFETGSDTGHWQVYVFVDFLVQQLPQTSIATMQRQLRERQEFFSWLEPLFVVEGVATGTSTPFPDQMDDAWWSFAYERSQSAQAPPPVPLPQQDLQLLCSRDEKVADPVALYRYQSQTETWIEENEGPVLISPLPDDSGLLLQDAPFFNGEESQAHIYLWRDGAKSLVFSHDNYAISFGETDPTGRYLVVYAVNSQGAGDLPESVLVDLGQCRDDGCETQPLPGIPVWSPEGTATVLTAIESLAHNPVFVIDNRVLLFGSAEPVQSWSLFRGDAVGRPAPSQDGASPLHRGYAPFWLDEKTYGYVRFASEAGTDSGEEVIIASTEDDEPRRLFGTDDLLAALPQADRPPQLFIRYVVPRPTNPDLLFALLADRMGREAYVFSFNRQSGEIDLRLRSTAYDGSHSLDFSPDGRWLLVTGFDVSAAGSEGSNSVSLHLHDIDQNWTETFVVNYPSAFAWGTYDWSADGQWLATIVGDRIVNLMAPAHDYQTIIPRDFGVCSTVAWVNR